MAPNFSHLPNAGGNSVMMQPHQLQYLLFRELQSQQPHVSGWQSSVGIQERFQQVWSLVTQLRLIESNFDVTGICSIALKYEGASFEGSQSKEAYLKTLREKHEQLLVARTHGQQQQQLQIQAQRQAQLGMASQQSINSQMARAGISQQQPQQQSQQQAQSFHHLQHQMQASPLPGQQQQQQLQQQQQMGMGMGMGMGMVNNSLPQNISQQQQLQLSLQQQQQGQGQQVQLGQQPQQPQQQPQLNRQPGGQPAFTPQEQAMINEMTQRLMNSATEDDRNNIRGLLRSKMDQATQLRYQNQGMDLALAYFRNQAVARLRSQKHHQQAQGLQGNVNIPSATPMQHQRSNNASIIGGQGQGQQQQPQMPNQDFGSILSNVETFMGNKQGGILTQQDANQMSVPATLTQGSSTPQPLQGLPGPLPGANGQRPMPNNPSLMAQQQQGFNAQQVQQERMNQVTQATIRANAQAEARKLALQGQPGGMGPMPPQQSPAMRTLNTPLQTPLQNAVDPQQVNQLSTAQFGQAIDPRYVHLSQQRSNQGSGVNGIGVNGPTVPAGITEEQRQRLASLPKEKLSEVIGRWNATSQAQGGKQPTMMQVAGARPNQPIAQQGNFNAQALVAQFMARVQSGQQPQQILASMTPQQQMILRHQMASQSQGRPPNMQTGLPPDQHAVNQIDHIEFPQSILASNPIFRQVPPEVKRWAELKQWALQTPSAVQAGLIDGIKHYQRVHFQSFIRSRNQVMQQRQHQAGQLQNVHAGNQAQAPQVVPSGMAPVAPMGQGNGYMISQGDIQKARLHPSGRWASMSDDEIKDMILKNFQVQKRQRHMQAPAISQTSPSQPQQSATQVPLQRPSVPQPAQVQPNLTPLKQGTRPQPGQGVQPGQQQVRLPQSAADTVRAASQSERPGRTTQTSHSTPQTSSPSQSQKNSLKRSNSDDVVEVPNPNAQQVPQSTPRKLPQQAYTAQQLAALSPEQRQKYEQAIVRQASQAKAPQVNPAQAIRASPADIQQCQKTLEEEAAKSEPFEAIPMSTDVRNKTSTKLSDTGSKIGKVKQALPRWFAVTHDQSRLQLFCRNYHKISQQFLDSNMEKPKSEFSMMPEAIDQAYELANNMIRDVATMFPNLTKSSSGAGVPSKEGVPAPSQPAPAQAVPLNAANLQQQQQALKQQQKHNRTNSRSQPPAAPTSAQPPFPIDSPMQGMSYQFTQDQLRLPPAKKQKQSASMTPVLGTQNSASTTPLKTSSPELKNQSMEPPKEEKVLLMCPDTSCNYHYGDGFDGFEDELALGKHREEEHVIPLSNPSHFVQLELATMLGLDSDTTTKAASNAISTTSTTASSQPGRVSTEKADGIPVATAVTPMDRQTSGTGVKASPTPNKVSKGNKRDDVKDAFTQSKNVRSSDAAIQRPIAAEDPWASSSVNPQDLLHNFQGLETGAGGAISDMSVYRSITPNDTPESSKDGASEPTSDITEGLDLTINLDIFETSDPDWNSFGPADTDDLLNLSKVNVNLEDEFLAYDDNRWGDYIHQSDFDKPFAFETSGFSMNVE